MIEATGVQTISSISVEQSATELSNNYNSASVDQFNNAMSNAKHCDPANSENCIGNSILEGMQKLKSGYDEKVTAINDAVNIEKLTVQDVMKLQLEIAKLQMQEELMAKTASKTTQNVDTLLKSQ